MKHFNDYQVRRIKDKKMYISVFSHGNLPHRFTVEVGMFTKLANDENPNVRDFFDSTY